MFQYTLNELCTPLHCMCSYLRFMEILVHASVNGSILLYFDLVVAGWKNISTPRPPFYEMRRPPCGGQDTIIWNTTRQVSHISIDDLQNLLVHTTN
jgi:hypothetical protein